MRENFLLNHVIENRDGEDSVKLIGAFSTHELANEAISSHRVLSGFSEFPDGFVIDRIEIDKSHWNEGFIVVENEDESGNGEK